MHFYLIKQVSLLLDYFKIKLIELETMTFDEQYQIFFNQMKKAENNLKKLFQESTKGEKDLEETKKSSMQFNEKVLHGIKEIKEALMLRLRMREVN